MMGLQAGMIISLVIILMHNVGQLGVQAAALQQHLDGKYFSGAPKSDAAIKISENTISRKDHEIKIYMKGMTEKEGTSESFISFLVYFSCFHFLLKQIIAIF